MRSYAEARHGEKRREVWIWTAVAEEAEGRRWGRFEVGDRSGETFSKLPEAGRYRSGDCVAYGLLPRGRRVAGKGGEVNRNGGRAPG